MLGRTDERGPGRRRGVSAGLATSHDGLEPTLRHVLQSLVTLTRTCEHRPRGRGVPTWARPRHARLILGAAQVWRQLILETLADPSAPWRQSNGLPMLDSAKVSGASLSAPVVPAEDWRRNRSGRGDPPRCSNVTR